MSKRAELLTAIAYTIKDYRAGEIAEPTPDHVDRWVGQFGNDVQLPLLSELKHVLDATYFSKQEVSDFFAHQIQHKKLAGDDPCAYWRGVNFLDIQKQGHSQDEILKLFGESLQSKCGIQINDCGSADGPYFYLDDVIFGGGRVGTDLKAWVKDKAPAKATVNILVIGTHRFGEWKCLENLKAVTKEPNKAISFHCWAATRFENRRYYMDSSDVLWPAVLPNDSDLTAYMALEKDAKFPFVPRSPGGASSLKVFSGEEGRQLIERELLLAGVKIRARCENPKKSMRPLGYGPFGLGFGSTIVTYRNCPNNCPLALWWGDPSVTHGPFAWYPLLPRKTYAQDFDNSVFEL